MSVESVNDLCTALSAALLLAGAGDARDEISEALALSLFDEAADNGVAPLGLTVAGFGELIAAAGGRGALANRSTDWVKAHVALPCTSSPNARCVIAPCAGPPPVACELPYWRHEVEHAAAGAPACGRSFAATLASRADAPALVGTATMFISHAYDYTFLDIVDAVAAWAEGHPRADGAPHYFYFDLLCVNQHGQNGVVSFDDLRAEFGGGVRSVARGGGHTLFVLDYAAPVSLTRTWCVFEAAMTLRCGVSLEVVLLPRNAAAFHAQLLGDFGGLTASLVDVRAERATAFREEDRQRVHGLVSAGFGGFERVNQLVIGALRAWMVGAARAALAALPAIERPRSALQPALARLLSEHGEVAEAAGLLQASATVLLADRPERRLEGAALDVVISYVRVLRNGGDLDDAIELIKDAMRGTPDPKHGGGDSAVACLTLFAQLLADTGNVDGAVNLLRRLEGDAVPGVAEPGRLASVQAALANVLDSAGRYDDAAPLLRRVWEATAAALGQDHPRALGARNNWAVHLAEAGRGGLEEAQQHFLAVAVGTRRLRGDLHPATLESVSNFSSALKKGGGPAALRAVEELDDLLLRAFALVLGSDHPETLAAAHNHAVALFRMGALDRAVPLMRKALAARRLELPAGHPHTALSALKLAQMLEEAGAGEGGCDAAAEEELEALYADALSTLERTHGPRHASTLQAVCGLQNCRERRADAAELSAALVLSLELAPRE